MRTQQTPHSHWLELILNLSPKPEKPDPIVGAADADADGAADCAVFKGLEVSQAAQTVLSAELEMQQTEQVHELVGGLNLSPKPCADDRLGAAVF